MFCYKVLKKDIFCEYFLVRFFWQKKLKKVGKNFVNFKTIRTFALQN